MWEWRSVGMTDHVTVYVSVYFNTYTCLQRAPFIWTMKSFVTESQMGLEQDTPWNLDNGGGDEDGGLNEASDEWEVVMWRRCGARQHLQSKMTDASEIYSMRSEGWLAWRRLAEIWLDQTSDVTISLTAEVTVEVMQRLD